jgi:hypothetical protein
VEDASGPRFVVFEVSGTIRLFQGPLFVKNPYLTIAGQSAPSPGILIRGPGVIIDTHDVVVQHIRVRVGNLQNEPSALVVRDDADNVVVDHVSLSWAVWTATGVGAYHPGHPPGEVTILDSIVAESLACSGVNSVARCDPSTYPGQGYSNSRAIGIGNGWNHPPPNVTLLRNISANSNDRHPEIAGGTHTILVNNLIYNPSLTPLSSIAYHDGDHSGPSLSVVKGNVLIAGATTPGHNGYVPPEYVQDGEMIMIRLHPSVHADSRIYLDGNYYDKHCGGTACLASPIAQWMLAWDAKLSWEGINVRATTPPLSVANLPLSSAIPYTNVEEYLKANSGARPLDRDAVDRRIVSEITARTGSVPNSPSEKAGPGTGADGFPILAENRRELNVPGNPHEVVDGAGRTRIEAWLEAFARELEPASGAPTPGRAPQPPSEVRIVF